MARTTSRTGKDKRRSYPANRLVRAADRSLDPQLLVRVWRRALERRLKRRFRARVIVELHDNTNTMLTFERGRPGWRLRLHHMFLAAPDLVLDALSEFAQRSDAQASVSLDLYIEANRNLIRRVPAAQLRRRLRIDPLGRHHDLSRIYAALNLRYFHNRVAATITYGPAQKQRGPRKSIKMGSYSADSKVIRIHPALDQRRVPRYFVEWIVFHEMLHHVHPVRRLSDGRRLVHTPQFAAHEERFHDIRRARRWEARNLDLLLTS